jgi:hypothetical protein
MDAVAHSWGCGGSFRGCGDSFRGCGDSFKGMWGLLHFEDKVSHSGYVVAHSGDVVAHSGDAWLIREMWWIISFGDMVAHSWDVWLIWLISRVTPDCNAAVPGSMPSSLIVSSLLFLKIPTKKSMNI